MRSHKLYCDKPSVSHKIWGLIVDSLAVASILSVIYAALWSVYLLTGAQ